MVLDCHGFLHTWRRASERSINQLTDEKSQKNMKFDEFLSTEIGEFGRYQAFVAFLTCIFCIFNGINVIDILFTVARPINFRCDSGLSWETLPINQTETYVSYLESRDASVQCEALDVNLSDVQSLQDIEDVANDTTPVLCAHWVFDMNEYGETVSTQWNQVCTKSYMESLSQALCMFGILLGMFFVAVSADRIGRRATYMICTCTLIVARTVSIFAPNYYVYIGARMIVTGSTIAAFTCMFILGTELVGPKWRVFLGIAPNFFWSIGYALTPAIAYLFKDRIKFESSVTAAHIIPFSFFWLLIESPRWLYSRGQNKKAEAMVRKLAQRNGRKLAREYKIRIDQVEEHGEIDSFTKVMKSPAMIIRTLCLSFLWITIVFNYIGNIVNVGNLGGNLYVNTALSGLVEIPGYVACQFVFDTRLGRKRSLMIAMALACATTFSAGIAPSSWPIIQIGLSLIAKFAISLAYGGVYVYSAELYPTASRSAGFSLLSTASRLGSVTAPFVVALGATKPIISALIFSTFSFVSVLVLATMPETRGKALPQSLQDAVDMTSSCRGSCCLRSTFTSHIESGSGITDFEDSIYKPIANGHEVMVALKEEE